MHSPKMKKNMYNTITKITSKTIVCLESTIPRAFLKIELSTLITKSKTVLSNNPKLVVKTNF